MENTNLTHCQSAGIPRTRLVFLSGRPLLAWELRFPSVGYWNFNQPRCNRGDILMDLLTWGIIAAVVSVLAGGLGFTGVAAGAAGAAKILFGLFLIIALVIFALVLLGVGAVDAVTTLPAWMLINHLV
jgi:uncharacterized membrane protein YtjA (UPF0391 family)